jgi:acyl-ACP thioesterase
MLFDTADFHAGSWRMSLGQLSETSQTWVLTRLHLKLQRHPSWSEPLTIETWPAGTMRLFAGRDYHIKAGEAVIGAASTLWLMIDRKDRRPVSLPDFIREIERPEGSPVVPLTSNWAVADGTPLVARHQVRWLDLDLNHHANALSYLDWLLGPTPSQVQESNRLASLDLLFKEEAFDGDEVRIEVVEIEEEDLISFGHTASRVSDNTVLATARTKWTSD